MALGFIRRGFLENPLVGRQLATQLTGPRLALVFLLVAGSLLLGDVITFASVLLSDNTFVLEGYAGGYLYAINSLILYGLLACLLPIRVSGAIDGPRFDKTFDQLVVTGVSPIQMQLGNWGLGLLYGIFILFVSLPFQVYAYMLGGVTLSNLLFGYGVLALYSNVIIAVALASSVLEREWLGVPAAIGLFWLGGLLSFAPIPSVFGWATPVRFFSVPIIVYMGGYVGVPSFWDDPVLFLYSVPLRVYPFLLWFLIALPCVLLILLGPSHRFLPGLNNFGNVVLPGDRKRRFFRRVRFALTRKVELAFFYENRPRWLDGWDFPLRAFFGIGFVVFLWAVIVGLFFHGTPQIDASLEFWRDGLVGGSICTAAAVLFLSILGLGDPRFKLEWRERVGKWSVPRGWLLSFCVLVLLAGFVFLHWAMLDSALANAPGSPAAAVGTVEGYTRDYWRFVSSLVIFLVNCHLLGKILTRISPSVAAWRLQLLIAAGVVLCAPLIVALGIQEHWIPRELFPLLFISPFSQNIVRDGSFKRIAPRGFDVDEIFGRYLTWQLGFMAALAAVLVAIVALSRVWRARAGTRAALLAVLLLPAAASGLRADPAEKTLPIEATLTHGFDGQLFDAGLSFFTLVLRNTSGKTIRGTYRVAFNGRRLSPPRAFEAPVGTAVTLRWSDASSGSAYFYGGNIQLILEAPEGSLSIDVRPPGLLAAQNAPDGTSCYLVVSDEGRQSVREREGFQAWVYTTPFFLPEDHRMYARATTIFVGPTDLSRQTQGQRRALYDFVRAGGAVVFYGAIDRASLKGASEWEAILTPKSSSRVVRDGTEYVVEDFEDARPLVWLDAAEGASSVPLLSTRAIGPGFVGHLSCDLTRASLEKSVWKSLWDAMPRSQYPAGASGSRQDDLELRDSTSLFAVLGFFAFYALVAGPVSLFFFRRKSRRRWLPVWMFSLPLAFVILLPGLHASLHLRPSYAAFTRVAFFGPGARRGVAVGRLDVRSSGRQQHALKLRGENLSAFSAESIEAGFNPYYSRRRLPEAPFVLTPADDGAQLLKLALSPWGSKEVLFLADVRRDAPVQGKALFNQRTKRLTLQAACLSVSGERPEGQVAFRLPGETRYRVANLPAGSYSGGVLTLELATDPVSSGLAEAIRLRPLLGPGNLPFDMPSRPFIFLVLETDDAGLDLETKDLAFERELEPVNIAPTMKGKTRDDPENRRGTIERGGKLFRSFERTLILQELPFEIR